MAGASGLKLVKFFLDGNTLTGNEVIVLLVGCLVAFWFRFSQSAF